MRERVKEIAQVFESVYNSACVCVSGKERDSMCVWESVSSCERDSVCDRQCVRDSMCKREKVRVCMLKRGCICVKKRKG